jgi:hypothetical protein
MTQTTRILIALLILIVLVGAVLGIDALRRQQQSSTSEEATLTPGSIPIYEEGRLIGGFSPTDLDQLEQVSFVDDEEGKTQEGWMLRDVLSLHIQLDTLQPDSRVTVSSSSRGKTMTLTWAEVDEPANMVMFDLSGRGTLKLVSLLERLDVRDEWVQDVDKIEIER